MDIFYEESAVNRNAKRGAKAYAVLNIISKICLVIACFGLITGILNISTGSTEGLDEEAKQLVSALRFFCIAGFVVGGLSLLSFFYFSYAKSLCNVSYDYVFVTGELRISKVFNVNRRTLVALIDSNEMLQIGRVDSDSFTRLRSDPSVREIVCTKNKETDDGKDFIYVLTTHNGKTLYVLECRETLVAHMLKFVKRTVLATDYTSSKQR